MSPKALKNRQKSVTVNSKQGAYNQVKRLRKSKWSSTAHTQGDRSIHRFWCAKVSVLTGEEVAASSLFVPITPPEFWQKLLINLQQIK
ncbi:MAG: hypothetical protein OXG60_12035 [Chloroflexi bacterium]|nr:hypothetical protein [Chloroflexota bacterium]